MKAKRVEGGPESPPYKMAVQKAGIREPNIPSGIPMQATPRSKQNPGLGATNKPHPFKAGKTPI